MSKVPEYWVMVPGSEKYQVSNFGHFRRLLKSGKTRPIKEYKKHDKWFVVKVDFYGIYTEWVVHTIVADAFMDKPEPGLVLHHKNGFKFDNYAGNLEWITREELGKKTGGKTSKVIPVVKLDPKTGEMLNFYNSISAAARDNYIHKETICMVIRGKLKTAAGFGWRKEQCNDFEEDVI